MEKKKQLIHCKWAHKHRKLTSIYFSTMVKSNINPSIDYDEAKIPDRKTDVDPHSPAYKIKIFNHDVSFVLGKKHISNKEDPIVHYFYIHAISKKKVRYTIGVYEVSKNSVAYATHKDNDNAMDPNKLGKPIFFQRIFMHGKPHRFNVEFVTKRLNANAPLHKEKGKKDKKEEDKKEEEEQDKKEEEDMVDPFFDIDTKKVQIDFSKIEVEKTLEDGIFQKDEKLVRSTLPPETKDMQRQQYKEYKQMSSDAKKRLPWIARFAKDANMTIEHVDGDGHCFFTSLVNAFKDDGRITTVAKLRALLASHVTESVFQAERSLYTSFADAKRKVIQDKKVIDDRTAHIAKLLKTSMSPVDSKHLNTESEQLIKSKERLKNDYESIQQNIQELVPYMENITTLDKYRDYIRETGKHRPIFWANEWAIQTLEKALKFKCILFMEDHFKTPSKGGDTVINMVQSDQAYTVQSDQFGPAQFGPDQDQGSKDQPKKDTIHPECYIMLAYTNGNHYEGIRYKGRSLVTFNEIPYGIKVRLLNRSLENEKSIINHIQDFIDFRSTTGIQQGGSSHDDDDTTVQKPMHDPNVVFVLYADAPHCKIGNVVCDLESSIDKRRIPDFVSLNQPSMKNWRQRLSDDSMDSTFQLDNQVWHSVTHYLCAFPYKSSPAFYAKFQRHGTFSKEPHPQYIEMAVQAASPSGMAKEEKKGSKEGKEGKGEKELRPSEIPCNTLSIKDRAVARRAAIRAKVMQNDDIKRMLKATDDATLMLFERGTRLKKDNTLMAIRQELLS